MLSPMHATRVRASMLRLAAGGEPDGGRDASGGGDGRGSRFPFRGDKVQLFRRATTPRGWSWRRTAKKTEVQRRQILDYGITVLNSPDSEAALFAKPARMRTPVQCSHKQLIRQLPCTGLPPTPHVPLLRHERARGEAPEHEAVLLRCAVTGLGLG